MAKKKETPFATIAAEGKIKSYQRGERLRMKAVPAKTFAPLVPPTAIAVAEATDPGDCLAGPAWLEYDVGGPYHWKEAGVWDIWCRVQTPSRPPEYRCYKIAARKQSTAVAGTIAAIASTIPTTVVIYEVRPPMTAETIGFIETYNARLVRQRRTKGATTNA